jgi:hypothetical protein
VIAVIRKNGSVVEGEVFSDPATKIVCRLDSLGVWEPIYGLINGEQRQLPPCFNLNGESQRALEDALRKG